MLFVSFWNLSLANLPTGSFTNRLISGQEAAGLISAARGDGDLLCVSRHDLVAPYEGRARDNHVRLCAALKSHGISLTISDFIGPRYVNLLRYAEVREGKNLIVVDACFTFDREQAGAMETLHVRHGLGPEAEVEAASTLVSEIAPDTITFNLIQATNGLD
jgi:hypothetical protein